QFRPPPLSTLFPYTTLFRSICSLFRCGFLFSFNKQAEVVRIVPLPLNSTDPPSMTIGGVKSFRLNSFAILVGTTSSRSKGGYLRSEEHTSELQSRENLVCRL